MQARRIATMVTVVAALALLLAAGVGAKGPGPQGELDAQAVLGTAASALRRSSGRAPLSTSFTYQGQLKSGGSLVNGTCDFRFILYDAEVGGSQIGPIQEKTGINVANGLFTIPDLDFGGGAFTGEARWLEIAVRCPAGSGSYTALSPRQALTATPYALYAKGAPWSGLTGVPAGFADGVDDDSGGDITGVTAGTGLSGGGTSGDVTLNVNFAGTGSATTAARSDHNHDATYVNEGQADSVTSGMIQDGAVTASDMQDGAALAEILDDDGSGSSLDADLLDGQHGSFYQNASNINAGTLSTDRYSAYADLGAEGYLDNNADGDLLTRVQADGRFVNEGQANSVTSAMIVDGAVTASDLQDGAALAEILDDDGSGSSLDADMVDGLHAGNLARTTYGTLYPSPGSVTIEIPHWTPFTLHLASGWPHHGGIAFVQAFENDYYVAITYIKYNGDGTSASGGAECYEGDTTTILTFGSGSYIYTVKCPGETSLPHNLVLTATGVELRYTLMY